MITTNPRLTGVPVPPYGSVAVSIGNSGQFPDIQTAINALGSRFVIRRSLTDTLTVTNGSATMSGFTANTTAQANNLGIGDLIRIGSDTRYYKIKTINGSTITLWEPYQGTSLAGVATPYTTSYLSRITLLIQPGELNYSGANLQPGYDLAGISPYGTFLDEISTINPFPIANIGENNISGLAFSPGSVWGDMDHMTGAINPTLWAGADNIVSRCLVVNGDLRDFHSGGELSYPVLNGGKITFRECVFRSSRTPLAQNGGAVTPTTSNTEVNFDFCRFEGIIDTESLTGEIFPCGIVTDVPATFNFNHPIVEIPDRVLPSFVGDVTGFLVGEPTGASSEGPAIVNIFDPVISVANTGTRNVEGLAVTSASTVNVYGGSISATGTNATGVQVNNASAVVNVRGTQISGATYSIDNIAGSITVDHTTGVSGPVSGIVNGLNNLLPTSITPVNSTAAQNLTGKPVLIQAAFSFSPTTTANALVQGKVGPSSSSLAIVDQQSEPLNATTPITGQIHTVTLYVPPGGWWLMTWANCTLLEGSQQPMA